MPVEEMEITLKISGGKEAGSEEHNICSRPLHLDVMRVVEQKPSQGQ